MRLRHAAIFAILVTGCMETTPNPGPGSQAPYPVELAPREVRPGHSRIVAITVYGIGSDAVSVADLSGYVLLKPDGSRMEPTLRNGRPILRYHDMDGDGVDDLTVGFRSDALIEWLGSGRPDELIFSFQRRGERVALTVPTPVVQEAGLERPAVSGPTPSTLDVQSIPGPEAERVLARAFRAVIQYLSAPTDERAPQGVRQVILSFPEDLFDDLSPFLDTLGTGITARFGTLGSECPQSTERCDLPVGHVLVRFGPPKLVDESKISESRVAAIALIFSRGGSQMASTLWYQERSDGEGQPVGRLSFDGFGERAERAR